jgi:hypothetical protein
LKVIPQQSLDDTSMAIWDTRLQGKSGSTKSLGFSFQTTHVTSFSCVGLGNVGCIAFSRSQKCEESAMILNL